MMMGSRTFLHFRMLYMYDIRIEVLVGQVQVPMGYGIRHNFLVSVAGNEPAT